VPWLQFHLNTSAALAPLCETSLLDLGAVAVTLQDNADQALFHGDGDLASRQEPVLWRETRVSGLFTANTDTKALWQALPSTLQAGCGHQADILEDKDWEREWMQHYQPLQYAENLWICPSWLQPPDPSAINIMLDPGLAFGTGTHPTTAMCLQLLASLHLEGRNVLDYGCGSGVLAIAALLLNAESVSAVDNDPQALQASRDNAGRNQLPTGGLDVYLHGRLPPDYRADLVVANILAGPLQELAPLLSQHLAPGGSLLLSGILAEQAEQVADAYANYLSLEVALESEGWVALQGQIA
jgi:ribosomal protein L11 methyltransferase